MVWLPSMVTAQLVAAIKPKLAFVIAALSLLLLACLGQLVRPGQPGAALGIGIRNAVGFSFVCRKVVPPTPALA